MKVLVAIASYGRKNQVYLERLLAEYRSMPHTVDVVVLSNEPKDLGPAVEVRVGLPDKDPWSLPFGHKPLFADRLDDYDLFIYSEDDMLITRRNIEAFLDVTPLLPVDRIAGFLQYEEDAGGRRYCPAVHSFCHWVPGSVCRFGPETFAYLTNEHAACYILTREQLRRAIASGGFLVPPHKGFYDLLCTAATDPYTQCGYTKVLCITRIDDFMVYHLPNKYLDKMGLAFDRVREQMDALSRCLQGQQTCDELLPTPAYAGVTSSLRRQGHATRPNSWRWCKLYYEPVRQDVLNAVPKEAKRVLSIGCGGGATEAVLASKGVQVIGIPLDAVIAETAKANGIEVTPPSFREAFEILRGQRFDCILLLGLLPFVPDPVALLAESRQLLAEEGSLVATAPNFGFLGYRKKDSVDGAVWRARDAFAAFHVQCTTPRVLATWARRSGLHVRGFRYDEDSRFRWLVRVFPGLAGPYLSRNTVLTADRRG